MPRLKMEVDDYQLNDGRLQKELPSFFSNNEAAKLIKSIGHLMKTMDLELWISPRLMRKLKAFAARQKGRSEQGMEDVDDTVFLSWLQQVGSMEPNLQWEVESMQDNGGVYRILFEGIKEEEK